MSTLTRRSFLEKSTLVTATTLATRCPPSMWAAPAGSNDAIRLGLIGLGNKGAAHLKNVLTLPRVRVTGLCDVDPRVLEHAKALLPQTQFAPFKTTDARELLARSDLDAVIIATGNHWHALLTVWACQAGKDVYVEKPMARTVWEGRKMIEAATKYRRIVQVGTQYRSEAGLAEGIAFLHAGGLGKLRHVHAIYYAKRDAIGRRAPWYPDWLNYDVFCGPSPMIPLERSQLHYDWHWSWATGNGDLGNNGVHLLDIARRIVRGDAPPRRVLGLGGRYAVDDGAETPNAQIAVYDYPEAPVIFEHRGLAAKPGVNFVDQVSGVRGAGIVAHCEGGYLSGLVGCTAHDPGGKVIRKFGGDGGVMPHLANFFDAVRSRRAQDLAAPVVIGHGSAAICHFGNISLRVGDLAAPAQVARALDPITAAAEIGRSLQTHLGAHGIDLVKSPLRLGPWLHLDADGDSIAALDSPHEAALERARFLLRETQRPPYLIPEQV